MYVRLLTGVLAAVSVIIHTKAAGTCLRCNDDFNTFGKRRGAGGGSMSYLATGALVDGTTTAIPTTTTNFNEPSNGWRAVTELPQTIKNGVANFWIGTNGPTTGNVNWRLPEMVFRRRTQSTGTADVGPMLVRASTALTTPTATGMCTGGYAGAFLVAEKYGVVRDFTQLSVRVAAWNPAVLSGGVALIFSHKQVYSSTTSYALSQYVAVFRGLAGGPEVCAGVYKLSAGAVVALTGQSVTISPMPAFNNTRNPADATTPVSARKYSRIGVSKSGGTIKLWLDSPSTVILTVTDASPLPAGNVGIGAIGLNSAVFDDFTLFDAPTCTDGIWNGEEDGTDCGGRSGDAVCAACGSSETFVHDFGTDGVVGWSQETYCTSGGGRFPQFESGQVRYITNCAFDWPGSSGANVATWGGAWFMIATKWPVAKNIDITIQNGAGDNDRQGLMWRFVDSQNYYSFELRSETRTEGYPVVILRRRNGISTVLWTQVPMDPTPYDESIVQYLRVTMSGNRIDVYSNRDGAASANVLIASVVDPDPLDVPGYVGHIGNYMSPAVNQRFTYTITRTAPVLPTLPANLGQGTLSTAAQTALGFYGDATGLPVMPVGSLANFRGGSAMGYDLAGSPLYVSAALQPGVETGLSPVGNAVSFAGAQCLWAAAANLGDPALSGTTILLAFVPRSRPVAGTRGVVMSKGLREWPLTDDAVGWRLQVVNIADRPITGATTNYALQFLVRTGVSPSIDISADVAHPIAADGNVLVVAIRVRPVSTSGALTGRQFAIDAKINNASFSSMADNVYNGIVSSGLDGLLSMGASELATDGVNMAVFETLVFNTALQDSDFDAANNYLVNKYINLPVNCPDISTSQADASPVSGTCSGAVDGDVCILGCINGRTMTVGSGSLTCRAGRWLGSFPKCEVQCPTLTAVGIGSSPCRSMVANEPWLVPGIVGSTATYRHWSVAPASGSNWNVISRDTVVVTPPATHRYPNILSAVLNGPVWATSTAPMAVTSRVVIPATPSGPITLTLLARYQDALNLYAVDVDIDSTTGAQTLTLRRTKGGTDTVLCTLSLNLVPGSVLAIETQLTLGTGGTGIVKSSRGGAVWCQVTETAANYVSSGTAGYAVQAMPSFGSLTFGRITVERVDPTCAQGCSGVVANATCVLTCNPGTVGRGDASRMCLDDGSYTGNPLTCDNGAPLLADQAASVPELSAVGTNVGTAFPSRLLSGSDGSGTIVFEIVAGDPHKAFTIDSCGGQVSIAKAELLDFERLNPGSSNAYNLRVRAYVAGSSPLAESFANLTVTVTNANDPPQLTTTGCTVAENSAFGSPVCTLAVMDPDGSVGSYVTSFTFEEKPGQFLLSSSGALTVGDVSKVGILNYEAKSSYRLVVRVADALQPTLFSTGTVIVTLTDVPEAPVIAPSCAVVADASLFATAGAAVTGFNVTTCVMDEDAGASIAGIQATVVSNPLVFVLPNGQAQVLQSRSYTGATPYLKDGHLVVDFGTLALTVTDNTGLQGTGTIGVYVLANVSSVGPVIRNAIVQPITTVAGSGNVNGQLLINTNGQDSITFVGDNMLYSATDVITATAVATAPARNWTVTCRYAYSGAMSGSLPLADGIICPTGTGWGRDWAWTVKLKQGAAPAATVLSSIAMVTHYAVPVVTAIGPPGQPGQPMNYPTAGGTSIQVSGHNLGPAGAPMTVDFGIVDSVTTAVTWYTDMVTTLVPAHTTALGKTRPGAGGNMLVRVTVGGQTVIGPAGVYMSYNVPTISAISRLGSTGLPAGAAPVGGTITGVRTLRAGETIIINGTNFGPATTQGVTLSFGLPAVADNALPYVANCYYPVAASSHTYIYCTAPPAGSGTYTAILRVTGQASARTPATPVARTVQYHTAYVATVSGPGARLADTRGGQLVYFTGVNFGPLSLHTSGMCAQPRAWYGQRNGTNYFPLQYEMTDCQVLDEMGSQISCRMVAGTGYTPPYWQWTIISCGNSGWTGALSTIRYAPPIVTGFLDNAGSLAGNTRGADAVTIYGRNFGPTMQYVSARYYAPIRGTDGVVRDVMFNATGCTKPDPLQMHELLVCNLAPGAGTSLRWEVVVETQVSIMPTSAYKQPVVTAISTSQSNPNVPVLAADGDAEMGSTANVVYIHGTGFGPLSPGNYGKPLVQSIKFGPGGALDGPAYTVTDWSLVVPDSVIRVVLPPGIGKLLSIKVVVADVESGATAAVVGQTVSYASPRVTGLQPSTGPTRGNTVIKVRVVDAGLLDPTTSHTLSLNQVSVPVVDRFPSVARVAAANGDLSQLTTQERDESNWYLAFLLPEGVGAGLGLVVNAYRVDYVASSVASSPASDGPSAWFQYEAPVLNLVAADRLRPDMAANYSLDVPVADLAHMDEWRVLTILGSNLGSSGAIPANVEMMAVDSTGTPIENTWAYGSDVIVDVLEWSHERIVVVTKLASAQVRLAVATVDPLASNPVYGSGAPLYSNEVEYLDIAPAVLGVSGTVTGGYSTAGGQMLTIDVGYVSSFTTLEIRVGNATADVLSADGLSVVRPQDIYTVIIAPQVAAQSSLQPANMVFRINVRVPPGQGSAVPIVVIRDGTPGTGASIISYAVPTLSTVANLGFPTQTAASATAANPFRVPTTGSRVVLTGTNLGVCPTVVFGASRVNACDQPIPGAVRFVSNNHTMLVLDVPAGTGVGSGLTPPGYLFTVSVGRPYGDQDAVTVMYASYGLPTISSITAVDSAVGIPTVGGASVAITGTNFGPLNAPVPDVTITMMDGRSVSCSNVQRDTTTPHSRMTCTVPEGSGARLSVTVGVDDQSATVASIFSYDLPVITSIVNTALTAYAARGDTPGGYTVVVQGHNFGPAGSNSAGYHCVFVPYASYEADGVQLRCNGHLDSWDEAEVGSVTSWNHTHVVLQMPAGMGRRKLRISAAGGMSVGVVPAADDWTYNSPVITSVSPVTVDTDGGMEVTITGRNLGYGSTAGQNANRRNGGASYAGLPMRLAIPGMADPVPSRVAMRVNFFTAARCISSAVADDSNNPAPVAGVANCQSEVQGYGVTQHSHTTIKFIALPGVGKNRTLSLSVVMPDGTTVDSNGFPFAYTPPTLESINRDKLLVRAPLLVSAADGATPATYRVVSSSSIQLRGHNFGPALREEQVGWTAEEQAVQIFLGDDACPESARVAVDDPAARGGKASVLQCSYGADTADGVPLSHPGVPKVGYRKVRATVAGQTAAPLRDDFFAVRCAKGYYGLPGEVCDVCPDYSSCDGYVEETATVGTPPRLYHTKPVVKQAVTTYDGLNLTECITCHTQPRAKAGYFNMKGYVNDKGQSESLCPALRKDEGKRDPLACDYIVACDPPEACLADNVCNDGYESSVWPYRCGQCASGFYRSAGSCRRCPDSPELTIVFFFLAAVVAIFVGWWLNQKSINIAFLTIGLDYMQVISIFANTRVAWPPQIKELFRILSAFNLNIEIVAPECAFKGITYAQKWGMVMLLPLVVIGLLLVIHVFNVAWALYVKRQPKAIIGTMASPLIAMAQVLMYFLFLYITRSVFDIFTCRSQIPAEYDSAGQEITYMAGIVERCGIKGGTQERLLPLAVLALLVYVIGYPLFIARNLYVNRDLVMEDQLLRAKRVGDDKLTNPHAHEFRRRWARAYYQFKPDTCLWVLAILLRKFLIAISSLVFNSNQNFQMAAMLLVLFLAYAAQVRFLPYMGPSNFDQVLKEHQEAARNGDVTHLRLAATIAGVETKGRKRTRTNTFKGVKDISVSALAGAVAGFLFDYNTVEALLLASALLVALAGIMFGASEAAKGSTFYQQSREGVLAAVIILVAVSILYWLTVVFVEVGMMYQDRQEKLKTAKGQRGKKKGSRRGGDEEDEGAGVGGKDETPFDPGNVESASNPLFLKNSSEGSGADLGLDVSAVRSMAAVPSQTVWEVLRATYLTTAGHVEAMEAEAARLKAELAAANGKGSTASLAAGGPRPVKSKRALTTVSPRAAARKGSGSDEETFRSPEGLTKLSSLPVDSGTGKPAKSGIR